MTRLPSIACFGLGSQGAAFPIMED